MATVRETSLLTVAAVRRPKRRGTTEILFNEREQVFILGETGRAGAVIADRLRSAIKRRTPMRATIDAKRATVVRIEDPSAEELAEFKAARLLLTDPERSFRVDLSKIDPTRFNVIDQHLKAKVFRRCRRVIPSYLAAKAVFDYLAARSCHLPGPPSYPACIPFQYVVDGCYARAHEMRRIITTKYRYCCEKVFSFANAGSDRLRVKADKWGGCCVSWWYHVAPMVRVRVRLGRCRFAVAMVIDPSMFDQPVLLSTWLAAQENATCGPNANVSMYSIQPGSAYTPAGYSGTSFSTDPMYASTNGTLAGYHSLVTCP
jgi:hypothetical protein